MGYRFPEQPILFYPSLARRIGSDEALLLAIYHDRARTGGRAEPAELVLSRAQWLKIADFWDEAYLRSVTESLVRQGCIRGSVDSALVRLSLQSQAAIEEPVTEEASARDASTVAEEEAVPEPESDSAVQTAHAAWSRSESEPAPAPEHATEAATASHLDRSGRRPNTGATRSAEPESQADTLSRLDVRDTPPRPLTRQALRPQPQPQTIQARGPAPTFGGASGWRRHKDELQVLFEQHEERNQQLKPMQLGWRPSATFFALLPRHNIAEEYAEGLLDEFVLYWLDKDRKETNWDQKFLAWVKREWVRKQTRDGRNTGADKERQTGFNNENTRRDTREKRKQVTAAIMDIRDTDW
ncbi:DnaT-like ssDNA-binding domain-containing protein [Marinobacterium rhizophilum]|uniref:DnaT-like ssDNA-binding domain-containing protein n=1 Tax=Marinobacterium rhizophilum TaxID=420402 RepID=UPI0003634757|nr:DnaT-like ssDNA-binding domain-containing protein [Marinobacterium rhizophilum]